MSDIRSIHVSYMSTEFSTQTGTRGTAFGASDFTLTDEILTLNEQKIAPVYVAYADQLQTDYVRQADLAEQMGDELSEDIETAVLDDHANWTDVGLSGATIASGVATQITVSSTNVATIVRGIRRIVNVANGQALAAKNGLFTVWRAADFEQLEAFAQANGFNLADVALKNGIPDGYFFLGMNHYVSNSHAANHLFAGVRKIMKLGILKGTWNKLYVQPGVNGDGPLAGENLFSEADFGTLTPTKHVTLTLDINVVS